MIAYLKTQPVPQGGKLLMRFVICFLSLFFYSSAVFSMSISYANASCDTVILKQGDTILVRSFVEAGRYFYYIPCGEYGEKYIEIRRNEISRVGIAGSTEAAYLEEKRRVLNRLKVSLLFSFLTVSVAIISPIIWQPLIIIAVCCLIPQLFFSFRAHRFLKYKYRLFRKERLLAKRLLLLTWLFILSGLFVTFIFAF